MDFFYLHKSDRKVITAFLLVAVIATVAILLIDSQIPVMTELPSNGESAVGDSIRPNQTAVDSQISSSPDSLFPFDPNTADSTRLLQLGLKPFQVRNICKYRQAGGIYQSKEDFAQLYGLSLGEYRRLEPYIRIADEFRPASQFIRRSQGRADGGAFRRFDKPAEERDTLHYPRKFKQGETIDLTTADTSLLKRVPGIGSYYARKIVSYRKRLGGFSSVQQLDEIDGFPENAKEYLRIDSNQVQRLQVNRLSLNELRRHPYINYYQARAITDYRRLHGPLKSLDALRLLPNFTEADIQRITPYLQFE